MVQFSIFLMFTASIISALTPHRPIAGDAAVEASYLKETADIIIGFEGFSESAYWDVNACRIGFGSDTMTAEDGSVTQVSCDSVTTREDARRDLEKRIKEFRAVVIEQLPSYYSLPANVRAALISVAYNYGSLPNSVVEAAKSKDIDKIADAVEKLKTHDGGVNEHRRMKEAEIIRGLPSI